MMLCECGNANDLKFYSDGSCMECGAGPQKPISLPGKVDAVAVPLKAAGKIDIDFVCSSIGRSRSTGEIICLLLSLDRDEAESIVADVIKTMGLSLDEVVGWHNDKPCLNCGMSLHLHKENNGECC